MEPHDHQPDGSSSRTITIHLTRDTLLLIAALMFLAVAILLAVIFPAGSSGNTALSATGTMQATASGVQRATSLAAAPSATPELALGGAQAGYPAPAGQPLDPTPVVAPNSNAAGNPPIFAPTQLGEQSGASVAQQTTPYPLFTATATFGQAPAGTTVQPTTATLTPALFPPQPTIMASPEVPPTAFPAPTLPPPPTAVPTPRPTRLPPSPTPIPPPTAVPVDVLRGNIRWTAARSPIRLTRDQQLAPGATLIIEPGVEVRLAPGVSFFVEGTLYALGQPDRPVRFVSNERQRWEGLFGRPGSNIALEHTSIQGGGAGGTVLTSEGGNLVLHNAHINDNGGHIQVSDSRLEMRDSEIAGNDMPYGAALDASYAAGGFVIMTNNRIGGNRQQAGAPPVQLSNQSSIDILNLDLQGNLMVGVDSPDLVLFTNGPLQGGLTCNTLVGGSNGLSLRSETPQVPGFALNVRDNATEKHTPPIIPDYLKYGIGRGATSEIALDMRNNWWGSPLGPYEPARHADGRGEAVGDNIEFMPYLTSRPSCAPSQ